MKINKNYSIKYILDSNILIDIKSNYVVKLNKTSKDICDLINEGLDRKQIIDKLVYKYDVEEETITKDVNEFIDMMIEKGIINE